MKIYTVVDKLEPYPVEDLVFYSDVKEAEKACSDMNRVSKAVCNLEPFAVIELEVK